MSDLSHRVLVRSLGRVEYVPAWRAMQAFTTQRVDATIDEIWLLEHPPVYTIGLKGRKREFVSPRDIPFVHSDRGGDMTYHGPGQAVGYVLADLKRRAWGVKTLVTALEQSVIDLLIQWGVNAERRAGAPGVYVAGKKIAALGVRIRRDCSYHGLALNVDMDLTPFQDIDPCGYPGLEVTQLADLGISANTAQVQQLLAVVLARNFAYDDCQVQPAVSTPAFGEPNAAINGR
jgi:lipoyl(octanoyl) transferase